MTAYYSPNSTRTPNGEIARNWLGTAFTAAKIAADDMEFVYRQCSGADYEMLLRSRAHLQQALDELDVVLSVGDKR